MTLATRYRLDPARLARILASLDRAALDAGCDLPWVNMDLLIARHYQIADLALLHIWLRALQTEGHLELEVTE